MITIEKMLGGINPDADNKADVIISLMKAAYRAGHEAGYEQGFNDCKNPLADSELDAAFKDGYDAGYITGREDGYDEGCMDLTDDDPGSTLDEEEAPCRGCFGASFNDCDTCRKNTAEPDCPWK